MRNGIRESTFVKDDVSTSENAVIVEIVKGIGLLSMRITEKNATMSPRGKFGGGSDRGGICQTTKDAEVVIRWGFRKENLKWGFMMEKTGRETIDEISSGKNTFPPKLDRKMGLKTKGASGFKKMTMFSFNNAILLGGINTRSL